MRLAALVIACLLLASPVVAQTERAWIDGKSVTVTLLPSKSDLLMDGLIVGGTSSFKVAKDGTVTVLYSDETWLPVKDALSSGALRIGMTPDVEAGFVVERTGSLSLRPLPALTALGQCAPGCIPVDVAQRLISEPDRKANMLAIAYITLAGVDIAATAGCAGAGTCREANPLLAPLVNQGRYGLAGGVKMGLAAGTVWASYRFTRPHTKQRYVALATALIVQALVVGFNASQQVDR